MDVQETVWDGVDGFNLVQDRDKCRLLWVW